MDAKLQKVLYKEHSVTVHWCTVIVVDICQCYWPSWVESVMCSKRALFIFSIALPRSSFRTGSSMPSHGALEMPLALVIHKHYSNLTKHCLRGAETFLERSRKYWGLSSNISLEPSHVSQLFEAGTLGAHFPEYRGWCGFFAIFLDIANQHSWHFFAAQQGWMSVPKSLGFIWTLGKPQTVKKKTDHNLGGNLTC